MLIGIGILAKELGVSIVTIRRWERLGKITLASRTLGNHRRFNLDEFKHNNSNAQTVIYARVSSHDQLKDLQTQVDVLVNYCKNEHLENPLVLKDLGSGLNYKKKGLNILIDMILNKQIKTLIINHKDRLLRFGSEIIFKLCHQFNVKVICLNVSDSDFKLNLCADVIELMTVFCAKLYGSRAHKNSKKLQQT